MNNQPYLKEHKIFGWQGISNYIGYSKQYPTTPLKLNEKGYRVIDNLHSDAINLPRINFYGCSYTFGVGVDGSKIFPNLIQKTFPKTIVQNKSHQGYGTSQALSQMQRDLRSLSPPDLSVITFIDVHLKRNVACPNFLRNIFNHFQQNIFTHSQPELQKKTIVPRYRLDLNGNLFLDKVIIDSKVSLKYEIDMYYKIEVMEKIISKIVELNNEFEKKVIFVVLRKDAISTGSYLALEKKISHLIPYYDISFPRKQDLDISKTDFHPNINGHALIAKNLTPIIKTYLKP